MITLPIRAGIEEKFRKQGFKPRIKCWLDRDDWKEMIFTQPLKDDVLARVSTLTGEVEEHVLTRS